MFSGIGGLELGLEWTGGFETLWQVEYDEFASRILAKHWPDVRRYRDVREVTGIYSDTKCKQRDTGRESISGLSAEDINRNYIQEVDLLCGGFPCQDVSLAGRRAGFGDGTTRSGLWYEFARIISEIKPRWVLAENVPGLLSADDGWAFGKVLGDLASLGYNVWWDCIPAAACGAPHRRDRVFIVGRRTVPLADSSVVIDGRGGGSAENSASSSRRNDNTRGSGRNDHESQSKVAGQDVANTSSQQIRDKRKDDTDGARGPGADDARQDGSGQSLADTTQQRVNVETVKGTGGLSQQSGGSGSIKSDTDSERCIHGETKESRNAEPSAKNDTGNPLEWWLSLTDLDRVVDGISFKLEHGQDRLRCLGNAVVPQVAYVVGSWILEAERTQAE